MTNIQNHLTSPNPACQPSPKPAAAAEAEQTQPRRGSETLHTLLGTRIPVAEALIPSTPASSAPGPSIQTLLVPFQFSALSLQNRPAAKPRNGKIAHLPAPERDMVNRMLANNLHHSLIADALSERGYNVTARNISNWKTRGGYHEWCAAQAHALELRSFQDNLTAFLRRHDASELPEVGLQSAATNLSAILLRPDLMPELLAAPEKYAKLIELQCRLAREIQALQKNRDAASKSVGHNPERLKRTDARELERIRESYSSKLGKTVNDPDIPHRNFIPKELEPVTSHTKPFGVFQQLAAALAAQASTATTPKEVAS